MARFQLEDRHGQVAVTCFARNYANLKDRIVDDAIVFLTGRLDANSEEKALLLDQHVVAGIGNIYSDEILHASRLRPDRLSDTLTGQEITRLHAEMHRVLAEAIAAGGSTLTDTQYVDIEGEGGWFQLSHRVYDRAGERCLTCGRADIVRVVAAGRSTCYCPRCQR